MEPFDKNFTPTFLYTAIQQRIENPLSKLLLEGKFEPKSTIGVGVDPITAPGQFSFS
jgi:ATP-dependent Clp protease ATP-binding subunit ClpB